MSIPVVTLESDPWSDPIERRPKPRLALVSEDLSLPADEGLKKFVYSMAGPLGIFTDLKVFSSQPTGQVGDSVSIAPANRMMGGSGIRGAIRAFAPTHIAYVPRSGGTRNAFFRSWRLGRYQPSARNAMVILQSRSLSPTSGQIARQLKPDCLIAQGQSICNSLRQFGLASHDIPSGVDTDRFSPVTPKEKADLAARYGLIEGKKAVLHVGHLDRSRNVLLLSRVRRELDAEAILVASTSTPQDQEIKSQLVRDGVKIFDGYIPDIADLYRLADCYLFPVHQAGGAIEMPLSVLEAIACGVPVVTTSYGSLRDWLHPSNGIRYEDSDERLIAAVADVLLMPISDQSSVRAAALPFSWPSVARRLVDLLEPMTHQSQTSAGQVRSLSGQKGRM